ncbi:Pre-mRNA-splicing factor SPF27, partial [Ochromonadaceae sp. CCMP2298]
FECLPLIDRQFDDPAVQAAVHSIIGAEMRSFAPSDYLAYLPYPELRFASPALEGEMARMAKGQTSEMLDMSRYGAAAPSGRAEQDPVQWRAALRNAQVQVAHQENRVMNAELAEEDG